MATYDDAYECRLIFADAAAANAFVERFSRRSTRDFHFRSYGPLIVGTFDSPDTDTTGDPMAYEIPIARPLFQAAAMSDVQLGCVFWGPHDDSHCRFVQRRDCYELFLEVWRQRNWAGLRNLFELELWPLYFALDQRLAQRAMPSSIASSLDRSPYDARDGVAARLDGKVEELETWVPKDEEARRELSLELRWWPDVDPPRTLDRMITGIGMRKVEEYGSHRFFMDENEVRALWLILSE